MKLLADYVSDDNCVGEKSYQRLRKACVNFEGKKGVYLWIIVQEKNKLADMKSPFALLHLKGKNLDDYLTAYEWVNKKVEK